MDIRQLRYFVVIAEERQITRAARRLHMAQPPLSRQLALLEQELAVSLFERSARDMVLTAEGELLYRKAKSIINQLEETASEIKEMGEGLRGELSIGTIHSCIPFLAKKIDYFRENYPHVKLKIWEGNPLYLCKLLENREIELAFSRAPFPKESFSTIHFSEEPFVLVTPPKWSLPDSQGAILLKDLKGLPLLILHKGEEAGYHQIVINECRRLGIELTIGCECPDSAFLFMLIMSGTGASILPKSFVSYFPKGLVNVMDITDFPVQSQTSFLWLKDKQLSKKASRFIEC